MTTAVLSETAITTSDPPQQTLSTNRDLVFSPSPEFAALVREVSKLTALEYNWDFDGGVGVAHAAAQASFEALRIGVEFGLHAHVMPLGDGSLLAEWHHGDRLLQIEWSEAGVGEFNVAVSHELQIEGPLPRDASVLFMSLLERSRPL